MKNFIFCAVHIIRKRLKGLNYSTIKKHHLLYNYSAGFSDFSISAGNNNDLGVTLLEGLLIKRDKPSLNKNKQSLPFELFDDYVITFYQMVDAN